MDTMQHVQFDVTESGKKKTRVRLMEEGVRFLFCCFVAVAVVVGGYVHGVDGG